MLRHLIISLFLFSALIAAAQKSSDADSICALPRISGSDRESAAMIGIGQTTQWDTYLSNERYHGPSLTILSQKSRSTHWLERRLFVQHLTWGNFSYAKPRSDKHKTLSGFFHWQVLWHYHFLGGNSRSVNVGTCDAGGNSRSVNVGTRDAGDDPRDINVGTRGLGACDEPSGRCDCEHYNHKVGDATPSPWELNAGLGVQVNAGFVYNTLGGNNPASGRLSLHLLGSGQARYHFRWGRQRFTTSLQADIPLAGLFFSPYYGQSYYEIFSLGHYHHNVCFANPLRAFQANVLFSFDWHLKPTTSLRVGYSGQFMQSYANGLKTQDLSNYFILGYVRRF